MNSSIAAPIGLSINGFFSGYLAPLLVVAGVLLALWLLHTPASIADKKGYSYIGFWMFGLFCFFPALIIALMLPDRKLAERQATAAAEQQILTYKQLYDSGSISRQDYLRKLGEAGQQAPGLALSVLRADKASRRLASPEGTGSQSSVPAVPEQSQISSIDLRHCPQCGQPVSENAVFCGSCGLRLPASSER